MKAIIIIIVILALFSCFASCSEKEANPYDGKCDNCGRTAKFGGDGETEFCSDCFESFLDYVYEN